VREEFSGNLSIAAELLFPFAWRVSTSGRAIKRETALSEGVAITGTLVRAEIELSNLDFAKRL
jgi:hypothetical protein